MTTEYTEHMNLVPNQPFLDILPFFMLKSLEKTLKLKFYSGQIIDLIKFQTNGHNLIQHSWNQSTLWAEI